MRLDRRGLVVASGGLLATLAGCGAEDRSEAGSTIAVRHQYGTTSVPRDPRRVVTLAASWADTLTGLGVDITAEFRTSAEPYPWTPRHRPAHTAAITDVTQVSREKIAGYQPDLILAGYTQDAKTYRSLAAVAPTLPVLDRRAILDTWEDQLTTGARIFGRADRAARLRRSLDSRLDDFRRGSRSTGTFAFGQLNADGKIGLVTDPRDPAAAFITQATGLRLDPAVRAEGKNGGRVLLSAERIDVLRSDLLLMWALQGGPAALRSLPGWSRLPAVRRGSTVILDNTSAIAFSLPSVATVPYCLDRLRPATRALA